MADQKIKDEALSIRMGRKLSRSQINRIRRGESIPTIETARELERETGIPAERFVMGEAGEKQSAAA